MSGDMFVNNNENPFGTKLQEEDKEQNKDYHVLSFDQEVVNIK